MIGAEDDDLDAGAEFLSKMFTGMGDAVRVERSGDQILIYQRGLRVVRGLSKVESELVFNCWQELWKGTMSSQRIIKSLTCDVGEGSAVWRLSHQV